MRIIITGTVGLDKATYLEKVQQLARQAGGDICLCNVGRSMYGEAPDVASGRILDLPLARLHQLRRSVFKDILAAGGESEHLIVNTHATFRWRHGLFPAFDFDQLSQFDADMYVCLVDNVDSVHCRLIKEHQINHSLKDLLIWREEETLATQMMMLGCGLNRTDRPARFYSLAIGRDNSTALNLYRLILRPGIRRAYLSFPMTHVLDMPDVLEEIDSFRAAIQRHFIVFDPGDLEEHRLYLDALAASERGQKVMEVEVLGESLRIDVAEVMQVAGDIHGQLYARDFMMIDQAEMIISYIPELPDGKPGISSGVERELQHAHEATKEVFVIWPSAASPSPFVTETATKVFGNTAEALDYFEKQDYINTKVLQD